MPAAEPVERFRPTNGAVVGWLGIATVVAFGAVGVHDEPNLTGLSIVLGAGLVVTLVWAILLRPRATAYAETLVLHNPVTDLHLPMAGIDAVAVHHALLVWVGGRRYVCPGIGRSSRRLSRQRGRGPFAIPGIAPLDDAGMGRPAEVDPPADYASFVEQRITELARAARESRPPAPEVAVRRIWAWRELSLLGGLAAGFLLSLIV